MLVAGAFEEDCVFVVDVSVEVCLCEPEVETGVEWSGGG